MAAELANVGDYTPAQVDLIKRTICRGATDDELAMFVMVCNRTGLDPFSRQIHAVKRWNAKSQREELSIQTGIDGFRLIAERTGKYAGNDDAVFDSEDGQHPQKATATVWKFVGGQRVPFTKSARWSEFVQTTKDGTPTRFWQKMPYLMLGKVAEALALRTAFPQELSGLYTTDEMGQADIAPVEDAEVVERPKSLPKLPAALIEPKPAPAVDAESLLRSILDAETEGERKTLMGAVTEQGKLGTFTDDELKQLRTAGLVAKVRLAATVADVAAAGQDIDKVATAGYITEKQAEFARKKVTERMASLGQSA